MKYLNQIIVLNNHKLRLNEEIALLSRLQSSAETDEMNAELRNRMTKNNEEMVETLHAIAVLKEAKA